MNSQLYNEIREKVALAFETQVLQFLPDEELHGITLEMYPQVYSLKSQEPNINFNIKVVEFEQNKYFTHIVLERKESFFDDLKLHLSVLLNQYLEKHQNLVPEECSFKIKHNKKSISISIEGV